MWVCPKCKIDNYDNAQFCPRCGAKKPGLKADTPKRKKWPAYAAVSAAVILVLGIGYALFKDKPDESHPAAQTSPAPARTTPSLMPVYTNPPSITPASPTPTPFNLENYVYQGRVSHIDIQPPQKDAWIQTLFETDEGYYVSSAVWDEEKEKLEPAELYFFGKDGSTRKLSRFVPFTPEVDTRGRTEYFAQAEFVPMGLTPEGKLIGLVNYYSSWYTSSTQSYYDYQDAYRYTVATLETDGTLIGEYELKTARTDLGIDPYSGICDRNGNLLVNDRMRVLVISPKGEILKTLEPEFYSWPVALTGGRVCLMDGGETLQIVDLDRYELTERYKLPEEAYNLAPAIGSFDFCYVDNDVLYAYRFQDETKKKLVDFSSLSGFLTSGRQGTPRISENGEITFSSVDYDSAGNYVYRIITVR